MMDMHPYQVVSNGQHCIDPQCRLSYTPTVKKQCLIKRLVLDFKGTWPGELLCKVA